MYQLTEIRSKSIKHNLMRLPQLVFEVTDACNLRCKYCGYVAIEMMMNKLPVVVNSTTGLKEIVENGKYGYTFDFGKDKDIQKLKDSLTQILVKSVSEDILTASRNIVLEKYSISVFCEKINKLYDNERKPYGVINN